MKTITGIETDGQYIKYKSPGDHNVWTVETETEILHITGEEAANHRIHELLNPKKICAECGKIFTPSKYTRKIQKFCCTKCKITNDRKVHKERMENDPEYAKRFREGTKKSYECKKYITDEEIARLQERIENKI